MKLLSVDARKRDRRVRQLREEEKTGEKRAEKESRRLAGKGCNMLLYALCGYVYNVVMLWGGKRTCQPKRLYRQMPLLLSPRIATWSSVSSAIRRTHTRCPCISSLALKMTVLPNPRNSGLPF